MPCCLTALVFRELYLLKHLKICTDLSTVSDTRREREEQILYRMCFCIVEFLCLAGLGRAYVLTFVDCGEQTHCSQFLKAIFFCFCYKFTCTSPPFLYFTTETPDIVQLETHAFSEVNAEVVSMHPGQSLRVGWWKRGHSLTLSPQTKQVENVTNDESSLSPFSSLIGCRTTRMEALGI